MPTPQKQRPAGNVKKPVGSGGSIFDSLVPMGEQPEEGLKCLFYGLAGSGKTTLWGTFPKPILCMLASGGNKPGELRSLRSPKYKDVIFPHVLSTADQMLELVKGQEKTDRFKTVVLDHATGYQDLILSEWLGKPAPEQKSWGLVEQRDWGAIGSRFKDSVRALLSLSCNVVLVAHQREKTKEESDESFEQFVSPAVIPSIGSWLQGACDYICQCYVRKKIEQRKKVIEIKGVKKEKVYEVDTGKVEYCLRTSPTTSHAGRFRMPKEGAVDLPPEIVDPDYDKLLSLINGLSE